MRIELLTIIMGAQLWGFAATMPPKAAMLRVSQTSPQNQSEVVSLPLLALDRHGRPVTDLNQNELRLYEGKEEQSIESLRPSPAAPIEVGFLIDTSNSEQGSLQVLQHLNATNLAGDVLHPEDLAFVMAIRETASLVCRPTTDVRAVAEGLHDAFATKPSGGTALYDAIYWAAAPGPTTLASRKILIVLSDMQDNSSYHTRAEATARAQRSGTVIYPIVLGKLIPRVEWVTRWFAEETGGVYLAPKTVGDLSDAIRKIRTYLDNSYVLQYRPRSPGPASVKIRCTRKGIKLVAPQGR